MAAEDMNRSQRGAWYVDPYGSGVQERWWHGSRWTKHVRDRPSGDVPAAIRFAAPPGAAGPGSYRRSLDELVGEDLRLEPVGDKRLLKYELVSGFRQRVASLCIGGLGEVAHMECSEGEWRLLKRRRLGWELTAENAAGHVVAWYCGRRWRAGGTIFLRAGPQLDLVKSPSRSWTLRTVEREDPMMRMQASASRARVELMPSSIGLPDAHVAVLIACAIPLLEEQLTPAIPAG